MVTAMRRFRLDRTVRRYGDSRIEERGISVLGGSPLRLWRLSGRGAAVFDQIATGEAIEDSALTDTLLDGGAIHPLPSPRPADDDQIPVTTVTPAIEAPRYRPPDARIIVDDHADPPIPGATIRLPANRGPAAARNAGADVVTTEFVAFVDTDVELPDRWLDTLLPHFDDPRVALVAPRVMSRVGGSWRARYERQHSPLDLGPEPAVVKPGSRVSYVPAAAIVCRVAALRAMNGFDTALRLGEDVDLCWRLCEAGWRCRYEPTSIVTHDPRPTWFAMARQRIGYGRSAAALAERHGDAVAPVRLDTRTLAAWAFVFGGCPLVGVSIAVGSAAGLAARLPSIPIAAAWRLALTGTLRAGAGLAAAIRRGWWPLMVAMSPWSTGARRALMCALVVRPNPIGWIDDAAYSLGVWRGVVEHRSLAALQPKLTSQRR